MVKEIALCYRFLLNDYVVNDTGNLAYNPKHSRTFKEFEKVLRYLSDNYGNRNSRLKLDNYCRENHLSELERKLRNTKIEIFVQKKN